MTNSIKNEHTSRFLPPLGCVFFPALGLLILGIAGYFYLQSANYHSAIEATKEWAQLNEFPASATSLLVITQGSIFSREFTIEFDAPFPDIENTSAVQNLNVVFYFQNEELGQTILAQY